MNTGQVCKIHRLVELKHKYKLRLFIDESVSFGSLGQHGKGITEHAGISVGGTCEKIIPGLLFKKGTCYSTSFSNVYNNHRWMIWI